MNRESSKSEEKEGGGSPQASEYAFFIGIMLGKPRCL